MSVSRIGKSRNVFLLVFVSFKGCILFCVVHGGRKGDIHCHFSFVQ